MLKFYNKKFAVAAFPNAFLPFFVTPWIFLPIHSLEFLSGNSIILGGSWFTQPEVL